MNHSSVRHKGFVVSTIIFAITIFLIVTGVLVFNKSANTAVKNILTSSSTQTSTNADGLAEVKSQPVSTSSDPVIISPTLLQQDLTISSISPSSGATGDKVTIMGTGFTSANNEIMFGNYKAATTDSIDGKTLSFDIPERLQNCTKDACTDTIIFVEKGRYSVFVRNTKGESNHLTFDVTTSSGMQ